MEKPTIFERFNVSQSLDGAIFYITLFDMKLETNNLNLDSFKVTVVFRNHSEFTIEMKKIEEFEREFGLSDEQTQNIFGMQFEHVVRACLYLFPRMEDETVGKYLNEKIHENIDNCFKFDQEHTEGHVIGWLLHLTNFIALDRYKHSVEHAFRYSEVLRTTDTFVDMHAGLQSMWDHFVFCPGNCKNCEFLDNHINGNKSNDGMTMDINAITGTMQ